MFEFLWRLESDLTYQQFDILISFFHFNSRMSKRDNKIEDGSTTVFWPEQQLSNFYDGKLSFF